MRLAGPILVALLALGFLATRFVAGGGWTQLNPGPELSRFDGERRAVRQYSVTATDSQGTAVVHSVTLLGPAGVILEPWTIIDADMEGLTLTRIDGTRTRVETASATVLWDADTGSWHPTPVRFDDLSALPTFQDGSSLPGALRRLRPDQGELIDRAFPPREEER